jgi:hypothetical protein
MAATALHEVRLDWSFQDTPARAWKRLLYRGIQQTWYAARFLGNCRRLAPAALDIFAAGAKKRQA